MSAARNLRRRSRNLAGWVVGVGLAGAVGLSYASATTLTVRPRNASAFRSCVLTGYPTTSTAVTDAWADETSKTTNRGTTNALQVASGPAQNKRAFVRFDLNSCVPGLVSTASVRRGTLRLALASTPSSTRTYNVQRVVSPCPEAVSSCWTETGLTWNNQPAVATGITSSITLTSTSPLAYYDWDVTADVAAMVAGTASNYGWRIADSAEGAASGVTSHFASKNRGIAAGAPQLVIIYAP